MLARLIHTPANGIGAMAFPMLVQSPRAVDRVPSLGRGRMAPQEFTLSNSASRMTTEVPGKQNSVMWSYMTPVEGLLRAGDGSTHRLALTPPTRRWREKLTL